MTGKIKQQTYSNILFRNNTTSVADPFSWGYVIFF